MIIINFSHPLTPDHLAQVEALTGQPVARVVDAPVQFDHAQPFVAQVEALVNSLGLAPQEWWATPILVNPPSLNLIAVTLLAHLLGRIGYFPPVLRLRPVEGTLPPRYEVAEVIELHDVYAEVKIAQKRALLKESLKNEPPWIWRQWAEDPARVGLDESLFVQVLLEMRDEESWRVLAIQALGWMRATDEPVIQALREALGDKDPQVRACAVEALGRIGLPDERAIQALLEALGDKDPWVRVQAAKSLGWMRATDEPVIQALLKALDDEDPRVRAQATEALGRIGLPDERVLQALREALGDEDPWVRVQAAQSLGSLGWMRATDERVLQALREALGDKDPQVRACAVEALGQIGFADEGVIQGLLEVRRDEKENFSTRGQAARVLAKLGWRPKSA